MSAETELTLQTGLQSVLLPPDLTTLSLIGHRPPAQGPHLGHPPSSHPMQQANGSYCKLLDALYSEYNALLDYFNSQHAYIPIYARYFTIFHLEKLVAFLKYDMISFLFFQ